MTDRRNGYSEQNKQAWDSLYGGTEGEVWGTDPVPFVEEFLSGSASALRESSNILDAAAGEGRHLHVLLKLAGQVYATDASAHAMKKMERVTGEFEKIRCELENMPFEEDFFDFAILIDTVETVPNIDEVLGELFRILKPGGRLLCNIPGKEDGISTENMEDAGAAEQESYLYRGRYFFQFYDEEGALDLVRRNGFEVLRNEVRNWTEKPHPGFRNHEHSHTSRVFLLAKPEA